MKYIPIHSIKQMAIAAGTILVIGAIFFLPWRLVAQESNTRRAEEPPSLQVSPAETPPTQVRPRNMISPSPRFATGERSSMGAVRGMSSTPVVSAPSMPFDVAAARFEVTVYEVQMPEDRIDDLDAQALEIKAATSQELTKALAKYGKTKVLYKIDQTVNLYGEHIMLNTSEPMITGSQMAGSGGFINSVTYQQVGLIVNLSATAPKDSEHKLFAQVNFQLSALADSGVELSPKVKASSTRSVQLSHSETPRFGKPVVLLNVSTSGGVENTQPMAYVVRYVFKEIKP